MTYSRIALSALAIAALGLTACGDNASPQPGDAVEVTPTVQASASETPPQSPVVDDTASAEPATSGATSEPATSSGQSSAPAQVGDAIALAESEGGGIAFKIDDEDDDRAWEIDVLLPDGTTAEVKVDAEGRTVLSTEKDDDNPDHPLPSTTLLDGINAALAHTPGVLDDAELDDDNDLIVWKVEIDQSANGDDVEVYVDAETLEIIKTD